ncbi:hypothetical protein [Streptomyces chartreusis]
MDGVLVHAQSEKQDATEAWKKTFGRHPLMGRALGLCRSIVLG